MLLCDHCPKAFHCACLDVPLKEVPDGNWFCSERCRASGTVSEDEREFIRERDVRLRAFLRGLESNVPCTDSIKALNQITEDGPADLLNQVKMPAALRRKIQSSKFESWNGVGSFN